MTYSAGAFIESSRAGGFIESERSLTPNLSLYSTGWGAWDFKMRHPVFGAEGGLRWEF
tara:strand:+ start:103 stop:276 length:174 start_codon:yes stop_codon:yes gene_type:complete